MIFRFILSIAFFNLQFLALTASAQAVDLSELQQALPHVAVTYLDGLGRALSPSEALHWFGRTGQMTANDSVNGRRMHLRLITSEATSDRLQFAVETLDESNHPLVHTVVSLSDKDTPENALYKMAQANSVLLSAGEQTVPQDHQGNLLNWNCADRPVLGGGNQRGIGLSIGPKGILTPVLLFSPLLLLVLLNGKMTPIKWILAAAIPATFLGLAGVGYYIDAQSGCSAGQ